MPRCAGPVVSVGGDVFGEAGVREREDDGAEDGADDAAAAGLDGDLALAGEQETGKRKCTTYWSRPNMVCVRTHPTCKAGPRLCGVSSISSFSMAFSACFCYFFFGFQKRRGMRRAVLRLWLSVAVCTAMLCALPVTGTGWTEDDLWMAEMKLEELRDAAADQVSEPCVRRAVLCCPLAARQVRDAAFKGRESSARTDAAHTHALVRQAKLIEHLKAGESCIQSNQECTRPHLSAASKLRRVQADRFKLLREDETVQDRISETVSLQMPNSARIVASRFLPFMFSNSTRDADQEAAGGAMYGVVADSKRTLHIFQVAGNDAGVSVLSQASGHVGAITSMAVDTRHLPEYKILTGSSDGEVRMHTLNAPPRRRRNERGVMLPFNASADVWLPNLTLASVFVPSAAPAVRGVSTRMHAVDFARNGRRAITAVEFIQKGRTFTILAADEIGRISLHLRNGSISASAQTKNSTGVRCAVPFNTFCALCTDAGVLFYEGKDRRLLNQFCTQYPALDEGMPDADPVVVQEEDAKTGELRNRTVMPEKAQRGPAQPLAAGIVSLAQDPANTVNWFAGTRDGRIFTLQIRGEKHRVRCSIVSEMTMAPASAAVYVNTLKGYLFAMPAPAPEPAMQVYNITYTSRATPPELMISMPINTVLQDQRHGASFEVISDKSKRLLIAGGHYTASVWTARLPYNSQSDWGLGALQYLRHPLLLGAMGFFFMWQVRVLLSTFTHSLSFSLSLFLSLSLLSLCPSLSCSPFH